MSIFMHWRMLNWLLIVPPILTIFFMLLLPETPYWLAAKNQTESAEQALAWLRNNHELYEELREITEKCTDSKKSMKQRLKETLKALKSRTFWKPFLLAKPLNLLYNC